MIGKRRLFFFNPSTVIAKKSRDKQGRYFNYRYFLIRGSRQGQWAVDVDCEDYTADWKGDKEGWRKIKKHTKISSKETLKVADEFCPQMERLVEEAKSGTITYFQYPPSNIGRGGGGGMISSGTGIGNAIHSNQMHLQRVNSFNQLNQLRNFPNGPQF